MFKVNNRNFRKKLEVCSVLAVKILERPHWRRSGVFVANFEHIPCASVSVVDFEQVNAGWEVSLKFGRAYTTN